MGAASPDGLWFALCQIPFRRVLRSCSKRDIGIGSCWLGDRRELAIAAALSSRLNMVFHILCLVSLLAFKMRGRRGDGFIQLQFLANFMMECSRW